MPLPPPSELAVTYDIKIKTPPIDELPPVPKPHPAPIPDPAPSLTASIVEFHIVTFSILETPPVSDFPVPIPDP
jgi:hypothetical protein